jgi:hypothetical protein
MKLIRSNKKGFGIHSPSVYHLVTQVLFPPGKESLLEQPGKLSMNKNEKEELKLVFGLLHFYQPSKVLYCGEPSDNELRILKKAAPSAEFFVGDTKQKTVDDREFPFVVFAGGLTESPEIGYPEIKSVWWMKNLSKNQKMADFFQSLFFDEKIQITIKYKDFGIIIVDKKIPKQNYVIK